MRRRCSAADLQEAARTSPLAEWIMADVPARLFTVVPWAKDPTIRAPIVLMPK
ncbi:MAG: hypothetical protein IH899_03110 [Planctomycetes bacterium]|nr:hypothetical protein [Planctomycetota bacterium]